MNRVAVACVILAVCSAGASCDPGPGGAGPSTPATVVEENRKLSPHVELSEKYLSRTYAFSGMADNGKRVVIPGPTTDKVLHEQSLQRDGKTVYRIVDDPRKDTRWKNYFVSPDEKYVVLQDWLNAKPTEVLSIDGGKTVTVDAPEIDGHYNVYPFTFVKWANDSRSFAVEVTGTYVRGPGQFLAYRELWQIQAADGKSERIKRDEQPWNEKLTWKD